MLILHISHLNGCSVECVISWFFRWLLLASFLPQVPNSLSNRMWVFLCLTKTHFWLNTISQVLQGNGLPLDWSSSCLVRYLTSAKVAEQNWHLKLSFCLTWIAALLTTVLSSQIRHPPPPHQLAKNNQPSSPTVPPPTLNCAHRRWFRLPPVLLFSVADQCPEPVIWSRKKSCTDSSTWCRSSADTCHQGKPN